MKVGIGKANLLSMDENLAPITTTRAVTGPEESFKPNVKVWLVDDNDDLRMMIAEILSHEGGIDCVRHFSGPDALLSELASKPGPDVILLDVQMGDRNGLDAVRPIKSLARSTRVLMFTTCFNTAWEERALQDGASGYLLKHSPPEKVAARIRCANSDPAPRPYTRRRAPKAQLAAEYQSSSATKKVPRLLNRTLKMLRLFKN